MKKAILLSAIAAFGATAISTQAAVYTLKADVSAVYDAGGDTLASPTYAPSTNYQMTEVAGASVYVVDYYVSIGSLQTGQGGFGNVIFDLNSSGNVTPDTIFGLNTWQPDGRNVDTNGSGPGGGTSLWSLNGDEGVSASDLKQITVSIAGGVTTTSNSDLRRFVGQPIGAQPYTASITNCADATGWPDGNTYVGSLYVDVAPGAGSLSTSFDGTSYYATGTGTLVPDATGTDNNALVSFVPAPEPASLSLLGLGAMGLIARRRRA